MDNNNKELSNIVSFEQKKKSFPFRTILGLFGVVALLGGSLAGVYRLRTTLVDNSKAGDCNAYTFNVSRDGLVVANNASTFDEPFQRAVVYINGVRTGEFDVPDIVSGGSAEVGTVTVPTDGFSWEVKGVEYCGSSGTYETTKEVNVSCGQVIAYDENWNALSASQLANLTAGDTVYFTVNATASYGSFDMARFTINGVVRPTVTTLRPGSSDYYDAYQIEAGVNTIIVNAEVHHVELGEWL